MSKARKAWGTVAGVQLVLTLLTLGGWIAVGPALVVAGFRVADESLFLLAALTVCGIALFANICWAAEEGEEWTAGKAAFYLFVFAVAAAFTALKLEGFEQ